MSVAGSKRVANRIRRCAMVWFFCAALSVHGQVSTTATVTATRNVITGDSGAPGSCTGKVIVTWNSYDAVNNVWNGTVTMTTSGSLTSETVVGNLQGTFTGAPNSTLSNIGYAASYSGSIAWPPSTSYSEGVEVGGNPGGFYASSGNTSGTTPPPVPAIHGQNVAVTNPTGIPMVYVAFDFTTQQYLDNTAIQVNPGQTGTIGISSNGDDMQIVAISETMAQFESFSTTGSGMLVSDGMGGNNFTAGTGVIATLALSLPYAGMPTLASNGTDPTGGSAIGLQGQPNATVISGAPSGASVTNVNNGSITNGSSSVGATGALPVFGGGTNPDQTGNTGGLANGVFNAGVNAIVEAIGTGIANELGVKQVQVTNFPGNQEVNGTVAVSNFPSGGGGGGSFPSSIAISNFPSSIGGGGSCPSAIAVTNFPSSISATFPSSINVGDFPSDYPDTMSIEKLTAILSALDGGASTPGGNFSPSSALGDAQVAGAAYVGGVSWGDSPTGGGAGGGGTMPTITEATSLPSDVEIDGVGPSGNKVLLSFNPAGQIYEAATNLLTACRPLVVLAIAVWFVGSCAICMKDYVIGMALAPQATASMGIESLGPLVTQGKIYASAVAIVATAATFVAAVLGIIDNALDGSASGLSIGTILSPTGGGWNFTAIGYGFALMNTYFPMAYLAELALIRVAFNLWTMPIFMAAVSLVRFLSV